MQVDYGALLPEIIVATAACLVLVLDLSLRGRMRVLGNAIAFVSTIAALLATVPLFGEPSSTLAGMFVIDDFAVVMKVIFLLATAAVIWLSIPPMRGHRYEGEYAFLILCSLLGCMLMPSSRDLLMLFVSLELVSVPAFVIAGLRKLNPRSNEAALKFFLFGVISAGVFIYGISFVYGFAGSTSLADIATAVAGAGPNQPMQALLMGVLFIIAAFGFKVSAVPFHFWAPDTYEGSPVPLAAFLSVASKAAGFVGLLLVLLIGFPGLAQFWGPIVGAIAIVTMTVGNVMALRQTQLVRLLAYSSIAQAGYMLIPLALIKAHDGFITGSNAQQVRSLVTYLAIYTLMNLGAFAVVIGLSKQYPTLLLRDIAGLGRRAPLLAVTLASFMISLGGIPPFAGWFAKFAVFTAAIERGTTMGVILAVAMVLNSVISLYYYVGVVKAMYMTESDQTHEGPVSMPRPIAAAVGVAFVGVVALGVYPEPFAKLANAARLVLAG